MAHAVYKIFKPIFNKQTPESRHFKDKAVLPSVSPMHFRVKVENLERKSLATTDDYFTSIFLRNPLELEGFKLAGRPTTIFIRGLM
jgi:hypothetical protein